MMSEILEIAILGGGCFWCLDAIFRRVAGVEKVVAGYSGGQLRNPAYEDVCQGTTGHAEVVKIDFNPGIISYENILEVFWHIHDPTTLNRQGADVGTQYRSVIFYVNEAQKDVALKSMVEAQNSGLFKSKIVTNIIPLEMFYEAEPYHQNFYSMNRMANPYCMAVIDPKLKKFIKDFPDYTKDANGGFG